MSFPDVYAELHTTRHFTLGELRKSLSVECSQAVEDPDCMEALARADEAVAVAQANLQRAAQFISDHHLKQREANYG